MTPTTNTTPDASKRPSNTGSKNRSPTRSTTPSSAGPSTVARNRSVKTTSGSPMTARGSARKPGTPLRSESASEESQTSNATLVEELKEQLSKAEAASNEYQKQVFVLQTKLDEALGDHAKVEEASQGRSDKIEILEKEKQDAARRHRDLQSAFEADKAASVREKEEASLREEELTEVIQRLKDSLAQREHRKSLDGESILSGAGFRGRSSPRLGAESPTTQSRDDSQNDSKLVLQKDKIIESLRLELAEGQIRQMEMESAGGGRMQELENKLLDARMSNAKLMEDNESYQVLLSEKTLNGDFSRSNLFDSANHQSDRSEHPRTPSRDPASSSLADELDTADDDSPGDHARKLENELNATKDQNKALTLYVNKIISKLMQNEQFETLFVDGTLASEGSTKPTATAKAKAEEPVDLRNVSIPEDDLLAPSTLTPGATNPTLGKENVASSLLQRAGSLFGGRQRPRPKSLNPAAIPVPVDISQSGPAGVPLPPTPTASSNYLAAPTQDPSTAPSLPLRRANSGRGGNRSSMVRSHRRATSEWSPTTSSGMYRGPPSADLVPPSPSGLSSPRGASISLAAPPLILEDSSENHEREHEPASVTLSEAASDSGYGESVGGSTDPPGSPRSAAAAALEGKAPPAIQRTDTSQSQDSKASFANMSAASAAWFAGTNKPSGQMRPLRLVQEKVEADEAAKKANRSSFMGWFNKAAPPGREGQAPVPVQVPTPPVLGSSPPPSSQSMLSSPPRTARKPSGESRHGSRPSTGGYQEA